MLYFQFSIPHYFQLLLPTFTSNFYFQLYTSNFILHPSYFIELTYVTNNRIINRLLSRALLRLF